MFRNTIVGPRTSGRSSTLAKLIVRAAIDNNQRILVVTPNIAMSPHMHIRILIELGLWNAKIIKSSSDAIYLDNGSSIELTTISKKVYHGSLIDMLAIDEAQCMSDNDMAAYLPLVKQNGSVIQTVCSSHV